jgi:hypothetical protein
VSLVTRMFLCYTLRIYYLAMKQSRFLFTLPPKMLTWLRNEAERRGCKVCEVIRAFIQKGMDK